MMYTTLVLSNNIQQRYNNDIASSYAYIASLVVVLVLVLASYVATYFIYHILLLLIIHS